MRISKGAWAVAVFAICPAFCLAPAYGDIRPDDLVAGYTVEARGLNSTSAPSVAANHVYVVDSDGNVYFERDSESPAQIASITKMMTAIVALDNADVSKMLDVSENAASIGESTAYLLPGDRITLKDALVGLMVPSGNDAATVIAENIGAEFVSEAKASGGQILDVKGSPLNLDAPDAPYQAFVAKMNERANELGCTDTVFTNPHGLDIEQFSSEELHSTAKDVALMAAHAMRNEDFRDIVSMDRAFITAYRNGGSTSIELLSTDELIGNYEGACGIKTGYTEAAGNCFVGACYRDGGYLYAVVLDSSDPTQRFTDAKSIYDWVYGSRQTYPLVNVDQTVEMEDGSSEVPLAGRAALADWTDKTVAFTFADPEAAVEVSSIFGNVSQEFQLDEIHGGINAGDRVGVANFYQDNTLIRSIDLLACESVAAPNFLDSISVAWQRFFNGAGTADSIVYNQTPAILSKN